MEWNDLLVDYFFDGTMAGREVLLYANEEIITQLGEPYGVGVEDFIEAVRRGPEWATKPELCQRALQAYDMWRERGLESPPYIGYLVFFVLAAVTETGYAPHSYYPGLRKLMGESQELGMPRHFDSMLVLWDDMEKWSREDKHEELGRFVARIRGGWINVGLPRAQTVMSERERKYLANIFDDANLDPTDPPPPEIIVKILCCYGNSYLDHRTKVLLESRNKEDEVLRTALAALVLDELEEWDGTIIEYHAGESVARKQIHTSLRLCVKLDPMASSVDIYVRFKTSRLFPEEGLHFSHARDELVWECNELQRGWSTPLKDHRNDPPVKLNGVLLDWVGGEQLIDSEVKWRTRLAGTDVRLFRLGIDGLPHWIETQRFERGIEFLVACKSNLVENIRMWGSELCEQFEQKNVTGMPSGWLLFHGRNASESCPNVSVLTLSTTVRLLLEDGIKAGKRNAYFNFAPPKIILENSTGLERVTVNAIPVEPDKSQVAVYSIPEDVPSGLPIRIEVRVGNHCLSKYVTLEDFDLPDSFDDTPSRNTKGEITAGGNSLKACGAQVNNAEETIQYQGPKLTLLSDKVIFIGESPGEIAEWPGDNYPPEWNPVWAIAKRGRKHWEILFCGTAEQLKRVSKLPRPVAGRSLIKKWKEAVWHRRKRYTLPKINEVQTIWNDYLRLAKNV